MENRQQRRKVVASAEQDMLMSAAALDLDALRRGFAALSDRLAESLFAAGLDFDDVEIDRMVLLRLPDRSLEAVADYLSDVALFSASIEKQLRERMDSSTACHWEILGIRADAWTQSSEPGQVARDRNPTLD